MEYYIRILYAYLHINIIHSLVVEHLRNTTCNIFTRTIKIGLYGNKTCVASIYFFSFRHYNYISLTRSVLYASTGLFQVEKKPFVRTDTAMKQMRLTQRANQDTSQNMCVNLPREPFRNCLIDAVECAV